MKHAILFFLFLLLACGVQSQQKLMKKATHALNVQGDYTKSLALFTKAAKRNPANEMALNGCGMSLHKQGRYREALANYDAALAINPRQLAVYENRGNAYTALGNLTAAKRDFDLVIFENPDNASAFANRGIVMAKLGKFDEAESDYNRALVLGEHRALVYNNRGALYLRKMQVEAAERDIKKALEIDSNFAPAHANMGELFALYKQEYDSAKVHFLKAQELKFESGKLYFALGYAHEFTQELEEADSCFTKAEKLGYDSPELYYNRGTVRAYLDDFEGALSDFDSALIRDPENGGIYTNRALLVYDAMEAYDLAMQDIQEVIMLDKRRGLLSPYALNNLGYLHFRLNELDEAEEHIAHSLELAPKNSYAHKNMALVCIAKGKFEQACEHANEAIKLDYEILYGEDIITIQAEACLDEPSDEPLFGQ